MVYKMNGIKFKQAKIKEININDLCEVVVKYMCTCVHIFCAILEIIFNLNHIFYVYMSI